MVGVFEVVVAAEVDHGGSLCLRRGEALPSMGEDLSAQFQPFVEFVFHEPCGVRKITVLRLRDEPDSRRRRTRSSVPILFQSIGEVCTKLFLRQGLLWNRRWASRTWVKLPIWGTCFDSLIEGDLRAQFHVRKSKGAGACAGRER